MPYTTPPRTDLIITRAIPADPAAVYDTWLDAHHPGGPWFGGAAVVLDPRVGGLFHHRVAHAGREWAHYGRFVTLERPRCIAHTWMSEATRGLETLVTLTFAPAGAGTDVTLLHTGVPDDEFGRQHQDGWAWALGAIAQKFAPRPA